MSNAIQTKDNEANHLIIYCLNCIRQGGNAAYDDDDDDDDDDDHDDDDDDDKLISLSSLLAGHIRPTNRGH